jgi:glutaredoxin 3
MPKVEIYTTATCPYCMRAKMLLAEKNVAFDEISVDGDPILRGKMTERAHGGTTVPQIFIEGRHIGGCDDLYALEDQGALDPLLTGSEP